MVRWFTSGFLVCLVAMSPLFAVGGASGKEEDKLILGNFGSLSKCGEAQIAYILEAGLWGKHIEIMNSGLGVVRKIPTADGSVLLTCNTNGRLTITVHKY